MDMQPYDLEQAASAEARLAGVRPDGSTNLQAIAKRFGHLVRYVDLPNGEHGNVEFVRQSQQYCISIDRRLSPGRQNFVLAHELAHIILRHAFGRKISSDPENDLNAEDPFEIEANQFAGSLLIPLYKLRAVLQAYPGYESLYQCNDSETRYVRGRLEQKIAQNFNTSIETARYRMSHLVRHGLLDDC